MKYIPMTQEEAKTLDYRIEEQIGGTKIFVLFSMNEEL